MEGDALWPLAEICEEMASRTCRYGGCRGMSVCAFRRVLIRSPTEGSRVEEEAGLSFFYFFFFFFPVGYLIGFVFHCVILCRPFALTGKMLSTLYSIIKF